MTWCGRYTRSTRPPQISSTGIEPACGANLASSAPSPGVDPLEQLAEALRRRLIARARDDGGRENGASLAEDVRELVDSEAPALPDDERAALCARVVRLATGLGPLEPLLADPDVDEVMVNGPGDVYVERSGRIERTGLSFGAEAELMHSIERVLAPLGRRVDEASPLCD